MPPVPEKLTLECPVCRQRVAVPAGRRKLRVTCPACRASWLWPPDNAAPAGEFEIRPKTVRNAILVGAGCALFTVLGIWLVLSGEKVNVQAGLLSIAFFGVGGLYAIPRMLKRRVTLVLTAHGIEQRYPEGAALIPWRDVERTAVFSISSTKMVGIRLLRYDRYLDSMTPELAESAIAGLKYLKWVARGVTGIHLEGGLKLWLAAEGRSLKSFGKVGTLAEALMWSRENYGYDLALSWADLDRPAAAFVELLDRYRTRA